MLTFDPQEVLMNRFVFLSGFVILVFLASLALAGIPKMINYQGMLTQSDGVTPVVDTNYPILFKIYNASTSGTLKWSHTYNVPVANGLFNVVLGDSGAPIDLSFDEDYWLEITVGGNTLTPRTRLTSVGYAYRAAKADTASIAVAAPTAGGWTDDGSVVRLTTSTDKVGIGTTNPDEEMEICKEQNDWTELKLNNPSGENNAGSAIYFYEGLGYGAYIAYANSGNTVPLAGPRSLTIQTYAGPIEIRTNMADPVSILPYGGNVGIGTRDPERILHIKGVNPRILIEATSISPEVNFKNSDDPDSEIWALYKHGTTDDFRFYQNGDKVTIQNSTGNVGIGTTNPGYKLDVNGDINVTGNIRKGGTAYTFPDYVFEPDYKLLPLDELKRYVFGNKHLPNIISADDVRKNNGYNMDELLTQMLEKIEEQTLYIMQLEERIARLEKQQR
jgi:hypothetical protein